MNAPTRPLAWAAFQFDIPADWEVTAYAVEDRIGRLEFSTRAGFQAVISWEPCKAFDPEAAMQAFLRKHVPATGDKPVAGPLRLREAGAFRLGALAGEGQPCQAVHCLQERGQLLRWVFADASDEAVERRWVPLLRTFRGNAGPLRRVAVFGLDLQVPEAYELEDMAVHPANVMMAFETRRKARLTVRRWGLPELVLGGQSLEAFYPRFLRAQKCKPGTPEATVFGGHPAVKVPYEQRPEHQMDVFMGRAWKHGEAWLWHDEAAQRLYACEQIGPAGVERPAVPALFGGEARP